MSQYQCKNCDRDRDLNNNYVSYPSGYPANNTSNDSSKDTQNTTQLRAKIMFGSQGAVKDLREKDHAEKSRSAQSGRRK